MALYSGSIYTNNNYISAQYISTGEISNISNITILKYDNDNITIISGSITTYYQRIYSSGLNDWSYYKTTGSIDTNPSPTITTPQHSGQILFHEIIGKLQS